MLYVLIWYLCYGMAWHGLVRYGMVQYGVWYGMVYHLHYLLLHGVTGHPDNIACFCLSP